MSFRPNESVPAYVAPCNSLFRLPTQTHQRFGDKTGWNASEIPDPGSLVLAEPGLWYPRNFNFNFSLVFKLNYDFEIDIPNDELAQPLRRIAPDGKSVLQEDITEVNAPHQPALPDTAMLLRAFLTRAASRTRSRYVDYTSILVSGTTAEINERLMLLTKDLNYRPSGMHQRLRQGSIGLFISLSAIKPLISSPASVRTQSVEAASEAWCLGIWLDPELNGKANLTKFCESTIWVLIRWDIWIEYRAYPNYIHFPVVGSNPIHIHIYEYLWIVGISTDICTYKLHLRHFFI
jgi:hypothetical protein